MSITMRRKGEGQETFKHLAVLVDNMRYAVGELQPKCLGYWLQISTTCIPA